MKNRSTIRKFLAFVMLVLFTVSVTPKTYFHSCLADHGNFAVAKPDGETAVSKYSLDCSCDELIASAQFTKTSFEPGLASFIPYKEFSFPPYYFVLQTKHSTKDLRGPPTVA